MSADSPPVITRILGGGTRPAHSLPLHDAAAARHLEQRAAAGLAPHTLMQRAGLAVARLATAVAPHAGVVWILAGPGNNGGDGYEAAMHLRRAGREVCVTALGDPARLPADAAASLARAREAGVPIEPWPAGPARLAGHDLVVDALLGLGASRAPEGMLAEAVAAINTRAAPCLAVDLPSGLSGDTGHVAGGAAAGACVQARHTLCLLSLKPGLFTAQGRDHAGEIWFCDLGVPGDDTAAQARLAGQDDLHAALPARRHAQHKGSFGDVLVVGGAASMAGAAVLAARSALRRGAGRVYVQLLDGSAGTFDPMAPELMFRPQPDWQDPAAAGRTVVCGCGGGDAVRAQLPVVLARSARLVLDADALNAVAADTALQAQLAHRGARGLPTVLTPHPLEAARLLGCSAADVQRDRLAQARALARRFGAIVLLKGSGTVVAAPDGSASINPTGSAALATAGTGDVLAGWVGALLAQGADARAAAVAAAFAHGAAAEAWVRGHPGRLMRAGDLIG